MLPNTTTYTVVLGTIVSGHVAEHHFLFGVGTGEIGGLGAPPPPPQKKVKREALSLRNYILGWFPDCSEICSLILL